MTTKVRPLSLALLALGVSICLGLGIWQLQRLEWKSALLARMEAQLSAPPLDLAATAASMEQLDYHPVTVNGRFDHAAAITMFAAGAEGGGHFILTPLALPDGRRVLVNRGFVAAGSQTEADPPLGDITVTGIARIPTPPATMTPPNNPAKGEWYSIDLKAMATNLMPVYVVSTGAEELGHPRPVGVSLDIPNNHLEYAVTWFIFAALQIVIFVLASRRKPA